jgi:hypothetical protein
MVDAVDSFLNNAVDLYIKQLNIVGFRQARFRLQSVPESYKLGRNLVKSGRRRWIPEIPCQILARLAGSPAVWPRYRPGSGQNGRIPGIWSDFGEDRQNPAKMARFRQLCQNLDLPNIKKIFVYYFILTFSIL